MSRTPREEKLPAARQKELLALLAARFAKNPKRHAGLSWKDVETRLLASPGKLAVLDRMEASGGEPDVVGREPGGEILFVDCATQSPKGRRSVCYDAEALASRKEHKPKDSATAMAAAMGVTLLTEAQYRRLQELGEFDTTTSSWVVTPADIRGRGGALFCDRRYDTVFVYHNGAESYYAARGFRGALAV